MTSDEARTTVRITNIQRFCLQDGPGIRTTVFMKGCSLHCPWCANPETIHPDIEPYGDNASETVGRDISLAELSAVLYRDRTYYQRGGGVTFSGGEPLLQILRYEPLLREFREEGIHLAAETALFVPKRHLQIAMRYIDWVYVDMKILREETCRRVLGGEITQYLENLRILCDSDKAVHVRIPASSFAVEPDNIELFVHVLKKYGVSQVETFNLHGLAEEKYRKLGLTPPALETVDYAGMLQRELQARQIACDIIQIG